MKIITFKVMSGIPEFNVLKTAPLIELIQDIPKLLSYKIIPSFKILNSILKNGLIDAGNDGGCEWTPFEISESEYDELVLELMKYNSYLYAEEAPEIVKDYSQWLSWVKGK